MNYNQPKWHMEKQVEFGEELNTLQFTTRPQRVLVTCSGKYLSCVSASAVCPGLRLRGVQADAG